MIKKMFGKSYLPGFMTGFCASAILAGIIIQPVISDLQGKVLNHEAEKRNEILKEKADMESLISRLKKT